VNGLFVTGLLGDAAAVDELRNQAWKESAMEALVNARGQRAVGFENRLDRMVDDRRTSLGKAGGSTGPFDDPRNLHNLFLNTLAAQFEPPEPGAPPFMNSPAWRAKSRNTVLAGWAEQRHTWVLFATEPQMNLTGTFLPPPPAGFIEPVPELFRRLADLVEETSAELEMAGLGPETGDAIACLRFASFITDAGLDARLVDPATLLAGQRENLEALGGFASSVAGFSLPAEPTPADYAALRTMLVSNAQEMLAGHETDPTGAIVDSIGTDPLEAPERWRRFARILRQLETLAHKQLRGESWRREEDKFIRSKFYEEMYWTVRSNGEQAIDFDDGPVIAPVAGDPDSGIVLHVGTGKPREIYVIYPWHGIPVLCRGAVLPYYEYLSPERFNDAEWRQLLEHSPAPATPSWIAPLYQP